MEMSNHQLEVISNIFMVFQILLFTLFCYYYVRAVICIYNEFYKDRVKQFFLKFKTDSYESVSTKNVLGQKRH